MRSTLLGHVLLGSFFLDWYVDSMTLTPASQEKMFSLPCVIHEGGERGSARLLKVSQTVFLSATI